MKWSVVEEVYVTAQAAPSSLARSRDLFMSIIRSSQCTSANVPWLLRQSTKVCNQYSVMRLADKLFMVVKVKCDHCFSSNF